MINLDNTKLLPQIKEHLIKLKRKPVILCIGSDRVTGDSLGPLVGHLLTTLFNVDAYVYGTLDLPVTAINLVETVDTIKKHHAGSKLIAIDSAVGASAELGVIRVNRGGLKPGAADGKKLPKVGDVSITATVAIDTHANLYSVRLGFVYSLALSIAESISKALTQCATTITA